MSEASWTLPPQRRWDRGLALLTICLFGALMVLPLCLLPLHVPLNYNEGWNAYWAAAAVEHGALYPPLDGTVVNNYPPLSFYIVGAIGSCIGDNVIAGRLLSVLSLFALAGNVFAMSRWLGANRWLALLGTGQTLLALYSMRSGAMAMNDPQFLAQWLVMYAALLFLSGSPATQRQRTVLSALLIVVAGLVKHNVISLPLTLCLYAAVHDRRRLALFLAALLAFGAMAAAACYAVWGPLIVHSVLMHARVISAAFAAERASILLPYIAPYLLCGLAAAAILRGRPQGTFLIFYMLVSAGVAFWMISGQGTNLNVAYDFAIALGLSGVCVMRHLADTRWNIAARCALTAPVVLYALMLQRAATTQDISLLTHRHDWSRLILRIRSSQGPVACEELSICYWAGKPQEVDFFNFGQKLAVGALTDAQFRAHILHHYYEYIQLAPMGMHVPVQLYRFIASNYVVVDGIEDEALVLAPSGQ